MIYVEQLVKKSTSVLDLSRVKISDHCIADVAESADALASGYVTTVHLKIILVETGSSPFIRTKKIEGRKRPALYFRLTCFADEVGGFTAFPQLPRPQCLLSRPLFWKAQYHAWQ